MRHGQQSQRPRYQQQSHQGSGAPEVFPRPAWRESHRQCKQSFHDAAQYDQNQAGQMHKIGLARRRDRTASSAARRWRFGPLSWLYQDTCEVSRALRQLRRGWSAGRGSASKTSSPAPAIAQLSSTAANATVSIKAPRAVLINTDVGFIFARVVGPSIWRVSLVSGTFRERISAIRSASSNLTRVTSVGNSKSGGR